MQTAVGRRRWRAGLILALYLVAFGVLSVALVLALGIFLLALGPLGAILIAGIYLYWRKERRGSLS